MVYLENELPVGWSQATFGELLPLSYGKALRKDKRNSNGSYDVFGSSGAVGKHDCAITSQNCILVGRKGSAGAVHFSKEPCWPIDTVYYCNVDSNLSPRFWFFRLGFENLVRLDQSTAIPSLSRDNYSPIVTLLPPFAEQERIVDKIDELFSSIEAGERAIEQARIGVARYRKAILKAAVTGELTADWRDENPAKESAKDLLARILTARFEAWEKSELAKLDAKGKARPETEKQWEKFRGRYKPPVEPDTEGLPELPEGWLWASQDMLLSALITGPFGSMLHQSDYVESGTPLVNPISIVQGKITHSKLKFLDKETIARLERFKLAEGDIVIARRGDMGRCASVLNENDGWLCGTGSMILRPNNLVLTEYLSQSLQYGHALSFLNANAIGTTMKNLNRTILKSVPIAISNVAEQEEVISEIEKALSKADAVEATLDAQSRAAKALKQAVLKTAFEGKLVPQNPKDEPASELLKRIKEET